MRYLHRVGNRNVKALRMGQRVGEGDFEEMVRAERRGQDERSLQATAHDSSDEILLDRERRGMGRVERGNMDQIH